MEDASVLASADSRHAVLLLAALRRIICEPEEANHIITAYTSGLYSYDLSSYGLYGYGL